MQMIENEEKEKSQNKNTCQTHKQHLTVYCDNEQCQELLCATCILVRHKDHKIMDIADKVKEIKRSSRYSEKDINAEWRQLGWKDTKMEDVITEISKNASEVCDNIDIQKALVLGKYREAMKAVEKQAQLEKIKIDLIKQKQLKSATSLHKDLR